MTASPLALELEDLIIATYTALDDALTQAGIVACQGKLIPRRGPAPEVDDREVLCLALLQEFLGFESDHSFHQWMAVHPTIQALFPRRLSRPNFADRRALLTPLMERLCGAFCALAGEGAPPFSSSIPIPSRSAAQCAPAARNGSVAWRRPGAARP